MLHHDNDNKLITIAGCEGESEIQGLGKYRKVRQTRQEKLFDPFEFEKKKKNRVESISDDR